MTESMVSEVCWGLLLTEEMPRVSRCHRSLSSTSAMATLNLLETSLIREREMRRFSLRLRTPWRRRERRQTPTFMLGSIDCGVGGGKAGDSGSVCVTSRRTHRRPNHPHLNLPPSRGKRKMDSRLRGKKKARPSRIAPPPWVPAFAGMTRVGRGNHEGRFYGGGEDDTPPFRDFCVTSRPARQLPKSPSSQSSPRMGEEVRGGREDGLPPSREKGRERGRCVEG